MVPGLIESHTHFVSLANRPGYHVAQWELANNIAEVLAILAARRARGDVPPGAIHHRHGRGHAARCSPRPRLPTLQEIDAAVPDRPVFLYQGGGGPARTNTLGKHSSRRVYRIPTGHGRRRRHASPRRQSQPGECARSITCASARLSTTRSAARSTPGLLGERRHHRGARPDARRAGRRHARTRRSTTRSRPMRSSRSTITACTTRGSQLKREERTLIRLQINFLHNQTDTSTAAGAARAPEEPVPVLRQRHGAHRRRSANGPRPSPRPPTPTATQCGSRRSGSSPRRAGGTRTRRPGTPTSSDAIEQVVSTYEQMDRSRRLPDGIKSLRWGLQHATSRRRRSSRG